MISRGAGEAAGYSLGVEIEGGQVICLMEEGSTLPARSRRLFTTVDDGQAAVDINVVARRGMRSVSMGRLLLSGISRSRKGNPRIEIAVTADSDGLVRVRARDLDTGASQRASFSVEPDTGKGAAGLKSRVFSLITRVREESHALAPDPRLAAEIGEAVRCAFISVGGRDLEEMAACITVLETILAEMRARAGRPTAAEAVRG